jgi:hypothetical protein
VVWTVPTQNEINGIFVVDVMEPFTANNPMPTYYKADSSILNSPDAILTAKKSFSYFATLSIQPVCSANGLG